MIAEKRQQLILEEIQSNKIVQTSKLSDLFHVSTETIRKDLDTLAKQNLVKRVHGGAILVEDEKAEESDSASIYEFFEDRIKKNPKLKDKIAQSAVSFITEDTNIALDDGTSGYAMAQLLFEKFKRLNIITNSLKSATSLLLNPNFTVILTGGILAHDGYACTGDLATLVLEKLSVDILFLTVSGITEDSFTDQRINEIQVQKQMIKSARKVIVLVDHSKFNHKSFAHVCNPEDVDIIVTDKAPNKELVEALEKKGCKIIVAE